MKDWLAKSAIPDEEQLALQICLPGYHINRSNKLVLESKSDLAQKGKASPMMPARRLALNFAQRVLTYHEPSSGCELSRYWLTRSKAGLPLVYRLSQYPHLWLYPVHPATAAHYRLA
jgi:hypothetical protein